MTTTLFRLLENATEHIAKINTIIREEKPFTYIVGTDTHARERFIFAKKNEAVIDRLAVAATDAFSNIRAALDFGYWQIVSPFVPAKDRKKIQFPFCENAGRLHEAVKNRLAHLVSQEFFDTIIDLKPHGEPGGNKLLYLVEIASIPERHRDFTPMGDYKGIDTVVIKQQVPDFPFLITGGAMGMNKRDFQWPARRIDVRRKWIGELIPGSGYIFEKELAVPIDVVFSIAAANYTGPVVPTLYRIRDVTRDILAILERFA